MASDPLPEPWRSFLRDLDTQLAGPTELHCLGGFVVAQCYGLMRPTADIDILESRARICSRSRNWPAGPAHSTSDTASTSTSSRSPMYRTTTMSASPPLSMQHSRNCGSASSNGTIWFWPRSFGTTTETAPMSRQLREDLDSISTASRALRRGAPAKAWQAGTRRPHAEALDRDHRGNEAAQAG